MCRSRWSAISSGYELRQESSTPLAKRRADRGAPFLPPPVVLLGVYQPRPPRPFLTPSCRPISLQTCKFSLPSHFVLVPYLKCFIRVLRRVCPNWAIPFSRSYFSRHLYQSWYSISIGSLRKSDRVSLAYLVTLSDVSSRNRLVGNLPLYLFLSGLLFGCRLAPFRPGYRCLAGTWRHPLAILSFPSRSTPPMRLNGRHVRGGRDDRVGCYFIPP